MEKEPRRAQIEDEGAAHKYFAMIPHTITRGKRGRGLSLPARWLYIYLKSIAGEGGICNKSTSTIVKEAQLGRGTIPGAKEELLKAGLITVVSREGRYHATDQIRIVDLWPENMQEFKGQGCSSGEQPSCSSGEQPSCSSGEQPSCSSGEQQVSPEKSTQAQPSCSSGEQLGCSCGELGCSCGEPKKIPLKKNQDPKDLNSPSLTLPHVADSGERETDHVAQCNGMYIPIKDLLTEGFQRFWDTYPGPRDRQRKAAIFWYTHKLEQRTDEITEKVARLRVTDWRTLERRFIPKLLNWLTEGCYDDPLVSLEEPYSHVSPEDFTTPRQKREAHAIEDYVRSVHGNTTGHPSLHHGDATTLDRSDYRRVD